MPKFSVIIINLSFSAVFFGANSQDKCDQICSRFFYDEKLLEKMIRLEHSTNLMMDEFRNIQEKVTADIAILRQETDAMKLNVQQEQVSHRKDIEDLKQGVENATEEMRKIIEASLQKPSYAFSVYWLADTVLAVGEDVIFSKKLLDERDLYDVRSGKYRVPVTGVYYFTAALCSYSNTEYGAVDFVADGNRIGALDVGDNYYLECSSSSAVAKLQKDTRVWLKVTNAMSCRNSDDYGGFNHFTGYLVNER